MTSGIDWSDVQITETDTDDMFDLPDVPDENIANEQYTEPDADLIDKPARSAKAKQYEKKLKRGFGNLTRIALSRPQTVADGATLMLYAPKVSESWGDLAVGNKTISGAIEMFEQTTSSPVTAAIAATAPMLMQIVRNHEASLEPKIREIKFGRFRFKLPRKIGIRLGLFRNYTDEPKSIIDHVFSDPRIIASLEKNRVIVANPYTK